MYNIIISLQLLGRDRVIRDVKPVGDKLIFATGTEIHVVDREPIFSTLIVQSPQKHSVRANQPSEYRHHGHHILNAHRRDISCLDVVEGAVKAVASGSKDRKIVIWCFEVINSKITLVQNIMEKII